MDTHTKFTFGGRVGMGKSFGVNACNGRTEKYRNAFVAKNFEQLIVHEVHI
jgi:hypothetical protein